MANVSGAGSIAITPGDPAGIGPEIFLNMLVDRSWDNLELIQVFAPPRVLVECAESLNLNLKFRGSMIENGKTPCRIIPVGDESLGWRPGHPSIEGARAAWEAIDRATEMVLSGKCGAIVTGPIHKAWMLKAGFPHAGHTEYLAQITHASFPVMLYDSPLLRVALVTTHIPISAVPENLTTARIEKVSHMVIQYLRMLGIDTPKIAVAGLNPHAGSGDVFGREEDEIIMPAVASLKGRNISVAGPVAPDTVFLRARNGEFDAVISLYHDQGSIPVKTLAFDDTVNVTLGLPIIRTSVDHGTAFEIAGTGKSSHRNLAAALELALKLMQRFSPGNSITELHGD